MLHRIRGRLLLATAFSLALLLCARPAAAQPAARDDARVTSAPLREGFEGMTTIRNDSGEPIAVPYLLNPPAVIDLQPGRQLFVDDYLIERSTLTHTAHAATPHPANPVLKAETPAEVAGAMACTFDDGVFYDPADQLFKMYYIIGYYTGTHHTALATSRDGIHWERPDFGIVPGTNIIIPAEEHFGRDNFSPWLDHQTTNSAERWKAYLYLWPRAGTRWGHTLGPRSQEWLLTSPDGIHWTKRAQFDAGYGDCTSIYYDPFRAKWVLNVRSYGPRGRDRSIYVRDHFEQLAEMQSGDARYWLRSDDLDAPDPDIIALRGQLRPDEMQRILADTKPEQLDRWFGEPTQLYTIAPAPYESLLLGLFTIHYGPENLILERMDDRQPKLTQIKVGTSRDGFHFARPDRGVFIAASKRAGTSDRGYVRAAGGGCLIVGDQLYFYYSAASGVGPNGERHLYAGDATHLATLRRDGFVSLDAGDSPGEVLTRPLRFQTAGADAHLFVNLAAPQGELRAEVLGETGEVIEPFSLANCAGLRSTDSTCTELVWSHAGQRQSLASLAGQPVRLRFVLQRGALYAFWFTPDPRGASFGYVAAGGPGFTAGKDLPTVR